MAFPAQSHFTTAGRFSPPPVGFGKRFVNAVSRQFGFWRTQGAADAMRAVKSWEQGTNTEPSLAHVKWEAVIIAKDVILDFVSDEERTPVDKVCEVMRHTVKQLSNRYDSVFGVMVSNLTAYSLRNNGSNSFCKDFMNVADGLFSDGEVNWGRIVAVYAFACRLAAREMASKGHFPQKLAIVVGKYVSDRLGQWIFENGGWEGCVECFTVRDQPEVGLLSWMGLLLAAAGVIVVMLLANK